MNTKSPRTIFALTLISLTPLTTVYAQTEGAGAPPAVTPALATPAPTTAGPKYKLFISMAPGNMREDDDSMNIALTIKPMLEGEPLPVMSYVNRERNQFTETIVGLDSDKKPNALRRKYIYARETEQQPGGKLKEKVFTRQGKTILIKRVNGRTVVTVDKGKLDAAEKKKLEDSLDGISHEFYPDHEVGPGDEWTVDSAALARAFKGDSAAVTGKFKEVVTFRGHRCARIGVTMTMAGKAGDSGMDIKMTVAGDLYHALDLNQALSITLIGPVTLKGEQDLDGHKLSMSGTGNARLVFNSRYLVLNGKKLAP